RREEIPHLSTYFLREASERFGKPNVRLSAETLDLLDAFGWPGNVPQLRNEVHRAVAMTAAGGVITPAILPPASPRRSPEASAPRRARTVALGSPAERLERDMIESALQRPEGNISKTARTLGLTRRGLYLKMDRLGISAAART